MIAAATQPARLPLPGGRRDATVTVTPMLTGEVSVPPGFLDRSQAPFGGLLRAALTPRSRWQRVPIPAFLVEHPAAGPILIDTGLHPVMASDPKANIGSLGTRLSPTRMDEEQAVVRRLGERDILPSEIGLIVMTHLHWDHASAIGEFPHSTFLVDAHEWQAATHGGMRHGYHRPHFDHPFAWRLLDFDGPLVESFSAFGRTIDLFGDESVRLCSTPGHSPGHLSVLLRLAEGELLIAADAAYTRQTIDRDLIPLVVHDEHSYLRSLGELRRYAEATPQATIIAGHDPVQWPKLEDVYR
ncbi:MAG TPA: N-acyl homoserine lactonase family protein [Solirubrobacteraceae bacterium]|jgi:glyoxylase-like metal-dependent hydrolase (beta-lactamase superfamily II)|nr:N-acyl homoserine lactonase family protein [Solirubrobacteraceae bacterium]